MAEMKISNVEALGRPLGQYSHMTRVRAVEYLFIAGMLASDKAGNLVGKDDFEAQCAQVFDNIAVALESAGAGWANVVQFTTYLVHSQDIARFMAFRQKAFPAMFPNGVYPPNTLLIVDRLVQQHYLVEVQAIAAL